MNSFFRQTKFLVLVIGLVAFLLYCPTITFEYAQDDAIVFTDNQFVQQGIKGIPDLLTKDTFFGFFKVEGKETLVQGGRYRPASLITFALEYSLWGEKAYMSHLINIVLYSLLCMLLYSITKDLLSRTSLQKINKGLAFIIVLLFTCHPIHTEVVANVKGRDELMVALFGFLALYLLVKKKATIWNYLLGTICILISYFSKEHALVFVALIPLTLYFFYYKDQNIKKKYVGAGLFTIASFIFLIVRQNILSGAISAESMELMNNPFLKYEGGNIIPFTSGEKWATILIGLGKYLQLMLFPHPLTSDYYPYFFKIRTFTDPLVLGSFMVHVSLVVLAIFGLLKRRGWAYGLFFYFGFLFLMSNIPFDIGTTISERFLFLPSYGFLFAVCFITAQLLGKRSASPIILGIVCIILCLFSGKTLQRSQAWKDNFTLLTTDVNVSKNSAKALHAAGGAYSTKASSIQDEIQQKTYLEQSNTYLQKAVEIHPLYANAYLIMGNNYQYLKQYEAAISSYNTVLKLQPENENALNNLFVAYRDGGKYYGEKRNDLQTSFSYLQQAYNLNRQDYETLRLMGVCMGMSGNTQKAVEYFEKAVELNPENAQAHFNLGSAYRNNGNEEKGILSHQKAIEIDPSLQKKLLK